MISPRPISQVANKHKGPLHPTDKFFTITIQYPGDHLPPKPYQYGCDTPESLWAATAEIFGHAAYWFGPAAERQDDLNWPSPIAVEDFEIVEQP